MTNNFQIQLSNQPCVHVCVCIGFMILLLTPIAVGMFAPSKHAAELITEKRSKEPWPETSLLRTSFTGYTAQLNRYMSDHIGLREPLLKLHTKFQYRVLDKTVSDKAIIGRNGWLFYAEDNVLKKPSELPGFGAQEARAWLAPMIEYQRVIQRQGGRLVVLLVPEKHHVYPEYLPQGFNYSRNGRRADLIEKAADATGITVINLLDSMLAEKPQGKLYFKSDSHWTQRGAFVGYRELVKELQGTDASLPFAPFTELVQANTIRMSGDLASLLNLRDEFEEDAQRHIPIHKQEGVVINTANHSSLLIIGDSFSAGLLNFVPSSFVGQLVVHHNFHTLPTAIVAKRKPEVVVVEIIERALGRPFEILD